MKTECLPGQKKNDFGVTCPQTRVHNREEGVHILLVDDNPLNLKLVRLMLRNSGYRLSMVKDGKEAVTAYTASPDIFDMILMDVLMPRMDGKQAAKAIRDRGFQHIPIIAMTASDIENHQEEWMQSGMNDYIAKPIIKENIFRMVDKWCLGH